MFFPLRCAFWLSIVYASMSWAPGTLAPGSVGSGLASTLVETGRSQADSLVTSATASAAEFCARHAPECIAEAARLTSLFAASERRDGADADEPATTATIPLPVRDPRRRIRDAKLAHAP